MNAFPARITDADGNPVSGAVAYFYADGTTNLQTIYANPGRTVPLANPLTADAGGLFPQIFLGAGLAYRIVYTGSDGDTTSPQAIYSGIVDGSGPSSPQVTISGPTHTATLDQRGYVIRRLNVADMLETLPSAHAAGNGFEITVWNASNGQSLTVNDISGALVNGAGAFTLGAGQRATFISSSVEWNSGGIAYDLGPIERFVSAAQLLARTTNGAAFHHEESGSSTAWNHIAYTFDASPQTFVDGFDYVPPRYDPTSFDIAFVWEAGGNAVGDAVTWACAARLVGNGATMGGDPGPQATAYDTVLLTGESVQITQFVTVTPSLNDASSRVLQFYVTRLSGGGGSPMHLLGVILRFNALAAHDG